MIFKHFGMGAACRLLRVRSGVLLLILHPAPYGN